MIKRKRNGKFYPTQPPEQRITCRVIKTGLDKLRGKYAVVSVLYSDGACDGHVLPITTVLKEHLDLPLKFCEIEFDKVGNHPTQCEELYKIWVEECGTRLNRLVEVVCESTM
jgi:hypothetical protein